MANKKELLRQRGASSVLFAVAIPPFLMLIWACVEIGNVTFSGTRARSGADGIAVAAAARYWTGREDAIADANAVALASGISLVASTQGTTGDVQFGDWDPASQTFTPRESGGRAVRAVVRYADGHPNGPLQSVLPDPLGPGNIDVSRAAIAVYCPQRDRVSMMILGSFQTLLTLTESGSLSMESMIFMQGDGSSIWSQPTSSIRSPAIELSGPLNSFQTHPNFDAEVYGEVTFPGDPYAATPLPEPGTITPVIGNGGVVTIPNGTHNGFSSETEQFVFAPGDHIMVGSIALSGNASITLNNARIVLTANTSLTLSGNVTLIGEPPTGPPVSSSAWIASRAADAVVTIEQQAAVNVSGMIYAPESLVEVSGAATLECDTAIVGAFAVRDTATATITDRILSLDRTPQPGRARLVK